MNPDLSHVQNAEGKEPKSADQIRAILNKVQRADESAGKSGPFQDGLPQDARLAVVSYKSRDAARQFQAILEREGVLSSLGRVRSDWQVLIDASDRERAGAVLANSPPVRDAAPTARRVIDYLIFGALMGGTLCYVKIGGEARDARELFSWRNALMLLAFVSMGAITGSLLADSLVHFRRSRRLQFGLRQVLMLAAVVGLAIFLIKL